MDEADKPIGWVPDAVSQAAAAAPGPAPAPAGLPEDHEIRRRLARDDRHSYLVEAPAGSGKTELLLQRYLHLLAKVEDPRAILAITFTRKAAGEIRERVLKALRDAENPAASMQEETRAAARAALEADRRWHWDLWQQPQWLQIQTLDALCLGLAQRSPLASGLGGEREMLNELGAAAAHGRATRNLLRQINDKGETGSWLREMILRADNRVEWLEERLIAMLRRRDQWLRLFGSGSDWKDDQEATQIRARLENNWALYIAQYLRLLRGLMPVEFIPEIIWAARFAAGNLAETEAGRQYWLEHNDLPAFTIEDLPAWQFLARLFLTKEGKWREIVNKLNGFPAGKSYESAKEQCLTLLDHLRNSGELAQVLASLQFLPPAQYHDTDWGILRALALLLPRAAAELSLELKHSRQADFMEIALAAQRALGSPEMPNELAYQMDCRLRHILVDEMQDTSRSQMELLQRLTAGWSAEDGRTLFLVGDPKQSIYRFREAEVRLFAQTPQLLPNLGIQPAQLRVNFRSAKHLVDWVNEVFPDIFSASADAAAGGVSFTSAIPRPDPAPSADAEVALETIFYQGKENKDQEEAQRIIQHIHAIQAREGPEASIAILARSRNHVNPLVAEMQARNLEFEAVEMASLGEHSLIQDLLTLTRCLLYPGDRLAGLAMLRAPWCGLTLPDLVALCEDPEREPSHAAPLLEELIETRGERLSPDGQIRLRRTQEIMRQARSFRGPLRQRVEAAWLRLGGAACLRPEEEDAVCLRAFWHSLESAEMSGDLPHLPEWELQLSNLYAPAAPRRGGVKLMTIHRAKGLEFDYVILPQLHRAPQSDFPDPLQAQYVTVHSEELPLLAVKLDRDSAIKEPHYEYLKRLRRQQVYEENKRVLYVAATRARKQLLLFAQIAIKEKDGKMTACEPAGSSLCSLLWKKYGSECHSRTLIWNTAHNKTAHVITENETSGRLPRRLPREWSLPEPPPALVTARQDTPSETKPSFDWAGEAVRQAGTVAHRWLRVIQEEGVETWNAERLQQLRPRLEGELREAGVAATDIPQALRLVQTALANTLADERGRWVLARHEADHCEWELGGLEDGELHQIRPDRCFIEDGRRWIVDYKLSQHSGGEMRGFIEEQKRRYLPQLLRYARWVRELGPEPVHIGIYFPLLSVFETMDLPDANHRG